ncbi:MAG: MucB/RseB C-terminal domain-containing protein [Thiolinea sp.]
MITKHKAKLLIVALGLPLFCTQPSVAADALQLLDRMQSAVYDLDYTGQLVYSRGDELSTYRISHQAGQEQDSVVRLNQGEGDKGQQVESFSLSKFGNPQADNKAYSFDLGGAARVAEHDCQVVVVRPKDKMRYLQRYCIDPKTGMLLKYSLMDREQKVLEQLMFTQLSIVDAKADIATSESLNIASAAVQPMPIAAVDTAMAKVAVAKPSAEVPEQATAIDSSNLNLGNWKFESLPAGFKVVKVIPQAGSPDAHQIVLSDGMAAVSVFIAPTSAAQKNMDQLSYANGATHILGLELAGHTLTFVGEVPETTLQAIQKGLRYVAR